MTANSETPMMRQFNSIKQEHTDKILFYRMGDFYEMFGDDAVTASKVLQIQLTTRNKNAENAIPMCGIPHHAFEQYLSKLIHAGFKVAICEQVEDPATAKGVVKREVVRVVTPGTALSDDLVDSSTNNFIAAFCPDMKKGEAGVAFCDLSTGEFEVDQISVVTNLESLYELFYLYRPKEILVPQGDRESSFLEKIQAQLMQILQPSSVKSEFFDYLSPDYFQLQKNKKSRKT